MLNLEVHHEILIVISLSLVSLVALLQVDSLFILNEATILILEFLKFSKSLSLLLLFLNANLLLFLLFFIDSSFSYFILLVFLDDFVPLLLGSFTDTLLLGGVDCLVVSLHQFG